MDCSYRTRLARVLVFSLAMGYLEAAVVVYLRALYYPEGFAFPIRIVPWRIGLVEIGREAATVVMIASLAGLAGKRFWERFGFFLVAFGVWDISYYGWLKLTIGWPASLFEPDILFLIPMPWIGPVIAPSLVSLLMIAIGILLVRRISRGGHFRPTPSSWILGVSATAIILFSFLQDYGAITEQRPPETYSYPLLLAGLALYAFAYVFSARNAGNPE